MFDGNRIVAIVCEQSDNRSKFSIKYIHVVANPLVTKKSNSPEYLLNRIR